MTKNPLVSIIIPSYNRGYSIKEAIESCMNQTYKNIEIIVVDDCSSDDTKKVVNELIKKDKRIKYFKNKNNSGAPFSRNKGVKLSKGEYINFLDSDDGFYEKKIELQIKKFQEVNDNVGVITCDVINNISDQNTEFKNRVKGNIYRDILKSYCIYGIHSMLIKKDIFEEVFYDENFPSNQEYDLMIQISKRWRFDFVPEKLCYVNESHDQISHDFKKKLKGTQIFFKKYHDEFKKFGLIFYMYNMLRKYYLYFKYTIGLIFGKRIYKLFP